jgi:osmoprotectant transport system ATP-binding protein
MITIEHLSRSYGAATVVDDVNLTIPSRTVTAIVGTSGSGKSTLLRMINRLVEPTRGRVLIDDEDTARGAAHTLRRKIGYVIQGHGLFPHRTVAENIATVPRLLGWEAPRVAARVDELLRVFGLEPAQYAQKLPHQLSGGQQQRVGVARALAAEPNVLLMDEPFGALDPVIRDKAQADLLDIQRRFGTTIVLVTHDIDEAFRLADQVVVMSQGRVLQCDTPAALLTRPADPLVARMIGVGDRALRLLSLTTAGEVALPAAVDRRVSRPGSGSVAAAGGIGGRSELGDGNTRDPDAAGDTGNGHLRVAASASLREVLSELVWRGQDVATVVDSDGRPCGTLTLAAVVAHGMGRGGPAA